MKKDSQTAFPLAWPEGWPRTPPHQRSQTHRFGGKVYSLSFDRARLDLMDELHRLGARNVILSTNVPLRNDGAPYAGAAERRLDDPGVAVYFTLKGKPLAMARDGFQHIAANMRSLFLAVEGLRQLERHGGSYMMERAFSGFLALPAPASAARPWWAILGYISPAGITASQVETQFRYLAQQRHPDSGGSHDAMAELNAARAAALKEIGQ